MRVPFMDLRRQYETIKFEIDESITRVIESGQFILGPEVESFEREISAYIGVRHSIGVASGTDALWLGLKAVGVGPGDTVIVPSFTFGATASAVQMVGASPVFADVNTATFNLDPGHVRSLLESRPRLREQAKAIIAVHLYGQPADMEAILLLAQEYGLAVVEDAAQAIGAEFQGRKVGSIGQVGCFSFFPTKNLGAYGDGGLVVTDDDELAQRVRMLRAHGSSQKYHHMLSGTNSRLDSLQAAILRAKRPYLDGWSAARQHHANYYEVGLSGRAAIITPERLPDRTHVFYQYTIRVNDGRRNSLQEHLNERGIGSEVYYPLPLHLQPAFRGLGYCQGDLPESERACREVLSLPIFPELEEEEMDYVVESVTDFLNEARPGS